MDKQRGGFGCTISICLIAILGFALVVHASYPGYMHGDNVFQLELIRNKSYVDWQPPFIVALWIGLMKIFPGPVGILVLDNLLIWGALALIAHNISRRIGFWALWVLAVPFMPGVPNLIGHANRDILFVAWMMAAFVCAFGANAEGAGGKKRIVLRIFVALFATAAFLVRESGVFALIPLLLYTFSRWNWRRNLLACLVLVLMMPTVQGGLDYLMDVKKDYPGDSIKTFHLLALSYFENQNLFPGTWTEEESRRIVEECYSPNQWENAARWRAECGMIHGNLVDQGVWGSSAMTKAWLGALVNNPVGAYAAMAATFHLSMRAPNSPFILSPPPRLEGIEHWAVLPPFRMTTQVAQDYMRSEFNLVLGVPWVFGTLLVCSMVLLLVLRLADTRLGLFALALAGSGAIYLITYFPFNVSAEYRYFYWSGVVAWLVTLLVVMAWFMRRNEEKIALPRSVRLGTCALISVVIVLVATPFRLPTEQRSISVTPLGEGEVTVNSLRTASRPLWMGSFEGPVSAQEWYWEGSWRSAQTLLPLVTTFNTRHQTVHVEFQSGPNGGKARVEEGETVKFVDTRAEEPGKIIVGLPAQGTWTREQRQRSWTRPANVSFWFIVTLVLMCRLSRRKEAPDL